MEPECLITISRLSKKATTVNKVPLKINLLALIINTWVLAVVIING